LGWCPSFSIDFVSVVDISAFLVGGGGGFAVVVT
jgi:hypothetical protein